MDKIIKELEVIDITEEGKGVCKKDNKVYFVENASFGEIVDIKVIKEKKNFAEGIKVKTLRKSDFYEKPDCPYFYNCDGCSTMDIQYEKELDLKVQMVKNKLKRIGKLNLDAIEIIKCPTREGFRNKIELKVNKMGQIGYYRAGSHQLTAIDSCIIAGENTNILIPRLKELIKEHRISGYDRHSKSGEIKNITIRENKKGEIQLILTVRKLTREMEKLLEDIKELDNIIEVHYSINEDSKSEIMKSTTLYFRKKDYTDTIGKLKFTISPRSFFQTNALMTEKLYEEAVKQMKLKGTEKILDLYCGIGSTSLYFGQYARKVVGVEIVRDAVQDANANKEINGLNNVEFVLGKSEDEIARLLDKIDILVVDPPRKGLDRKLIEELSKSKLNKIMYISCNPGTLARDLGLLEEIGFVTRKVKLVDMFVNSMQVETVVLMSRK